MKQSAISVDVSRYCHFADDLGPSHSKWRHICRFSFDLGAHRGGGRPGTPVLRRYVLWVWDGLRLANQVTWRLPWYGLAMPELEQAARRPAPASSASERRTAPTYAGLGIRPRRLLSSPIHRPAAAQCWLSGSRNSAPSTCIVADDGSDSGPVQPVHSRTHLPTSANRSRSRPPSAAWRPGPS